MEKNEFPSRVDFVVLQMEHNGKMSTREYERCYTEVNFERIFSGGEKLSYIYWHVPAGTMSETAVPLSVSGL